MSLRQAFTLLVTVLAVLSPRQSEAQLEWGQEYANRIKNQTTVSQLGPDSFGEQVNLFDGTTSFSVTDIDIPGNSELPVKLARKLVVGSSSNTSEESLFGNWEITLPYLSNISVTSSGWQAPADPAYFWRAATSTPYARCSSPSQPAELGTPETANSLNVDSGGGEIFLLTAATSPKLVRPNVAGIRYVSKGNWFLGCVPTLGSGQSGEGFWAIDPKGNKYVFNWMVPYSYPGFSTPAIQAGGQIIQNRTEVRLYPTRVEDRFGNWVEYVWQGRKLVRIVANDGRRIDMAYAGDDQIVTATAHGRTWAYSYTDFATPGVGGHLNVVTNPDGTKWTYSQNPGAYVQFAPRYETKTSYTQGGLPILVQVEVLEKVSFCSYDHYLSPSLVPFEMVHPSGARATFTFKTMRHGRTKVPGDCQFGWDLNDGATRESQNSHNNHPAFKDVWSLQSKRVEGAGLATASWAYQYEDLQACVASACTNAIPRSKRVSMTRPDGSVEVFMFGKEYGINESQLLSTELRSGGQVVSRVENEYVDTAASATMPFPSMIGESPVEYADPWSVASLRPMRIRRKFQDGVGYTRTVNVFDAFSNPLSTTMSNTLGHSRTDVVELQHDMAKWVIGATRRRYEGDTLVAVSETQFDQLMLPIKIVEFGRTKASLTYASDGTLTSVADGRGAVTSLASWRRGVPSSLRFPPTPDSPNGATIDVVVDDFGKIQSITNELGEKSCYAYDAMSRMTSVTYPSDVRGVCDTSRWASTSLEFRQLAEGEWLPSGIALSRWRQLVTTGSRTRVTYFDALLRPSLVHEYDVLDSAGTLRATRYTYDAEGRLLSRSYPSADVVPGTAGSRTTYDALGRVIREESDSELGVLATTTEYLAGLRTRVTDPRGVQHTTQYMAWDEPSWDYPTRSDFAEGKVISIERHGKFGWPLEVRQSSADGTSSVARKFVYDGDRPCKAIEPEEGVTVTSFDGAGNVSWSASGLPEATFGSRNDCQYASAQASGRVVAREYDARNRLVSLTYPDGRGDQSWSYTQTGMPALVMTRNDGAIVKNAFTYVTRGLPASEVVSQSGYPMLSLAYEYDPLATVSAETLPSGLRVNFAPNALGQATRAGTFASGAKYYPNGALKQFVYGNGKVHTMIQNARQFAARVQSGVGVADLSYTYDANGNPTTIWDNAQDAGDGWFSRSMTYDGLNRLVTAHSCAFGGDCWNRFAYDALDNLRSWRLTGLKDNASYIYDASRNRLSSIKNSGGTETVRLLYDAQGNVTTKNDQAFDYDFGNRLRATAGESYRYDWKGNRALVERPAEGSTPSSGVAYLYTAGGTLASQWNTQTQTFMDYVYLAGSVVAIRESGAQAVTRTLYQHTDALGSPVCVTDESGAIVERIAYDPLGGTTTPRPSGLGYTGHVHDARTGLTYMQQRYYDPSLGVFLSVDPIEVDSKDGTNFQRYWYANGSPYKFVDPDGRGPVDFLLKRTHIREEFEEGARDVLSTADPRLPPAQRDELVSTMVSFAIDNYTIRQLAAIGEIRQSPKYDPATKQRYISFDKKTFASSSVWLPIWRRRSRRLRSDCAQSSRRG